MRDFKKIIAWQKAHARSVAMTSLADPQRFRARPRLRSQLLRAVDAVGAQISEGAGKPSEAEFGRYLDMAMATARETENHLLLARDIGCLDHAAADLCLERLDEVRRVLYACARAVRPAAKK